MYFNCFKKALVFGILLSSAPVFADDLVCSLIDVKVRSNKVSAKVDLEHETEGKIFARKLDLGDASLRFVMGVNQSDEDLVIEASFFEDKQLKGLIDSFAWSIDREGVTPGKPVVAETIILEESRLARFVCFYNISAE